jgi:hypothetical protein
MSGMTDRHASLERLETRIDYQAARIDALYRLLELHGIERPVDASRCDALFDELDEDAPMTAEQFERATRPRATRLRVGTATGV